MKFNYMLQVLMPIGGKGLRFVGSDYKFPKPLILVEGEPMFMKAIRSTDALSVDKEYFIVVRDPSALEGISKYAEENAIKLQIVSLTYDTRGAVETALAAEDYLCGCCPLLIVDCDISFTSPGLERLISQESVEFEAFLTTFKSSDSRFSYIESSGDNVVRTAEKEVISNNATVGVYYWKKGKDYVRFANEMIKKNIRVNNEFYVCPVFNEAIKDKKNIILKEVKSMWGLGTPEDLKFFIDNFKK
jgi:dTDP-glucose pyrophosphorylase